MGDVYARQDAAVNPSDSNLGERQPLEEVARREPRVAKHWLALLDAVQNEGADAIRAVYDEFLSYFPNAVCNDAH